MSNAEGFSTHALFGFIRSIYKLIREYNPDYIAAVFDGPNNKQSRIAIYPEYKIHRKAMPQDLVEQVKESRYWCKEAGIPFLSEEGVEADDIIGSIALLASQSGDKVYLCSGDKDLCQLISDQIFVLNICKENLLIDEKRFEELYQIAPKQMVDYLSLVGDSSDNIPGIDGIGAKTAIALLKQFGSIDTLFNNLEQVKNRRLQNLIERGKEKALLSRQLAQISTQLPTPQNRDFFRRKEANIDELKLFYQRMGFGSLLQETVATEKIDLDGDLKKFRFHWVEELHLLEQQLALCKKRVAFHIISESKSSPIWGIAFAHSSEEGFFLHLNGKIPFCEIKRRLNQLFLSSSTCFYGNHLKDELHQLARLEITPPHNIVFDAALALHLIDPNKSFRKFNEEIVEETKIYTLNSAEDACRKLSHLFELEKEIQKKYLEKILFKIELPLLSVLFRMEERGIYLDRQLLSSAEQKMKEEIDHLKNEIYSLAGELFNINSSQQLATILFEKLKIVFPSKKEKLSTNEMILNQIKNHHPIVSKLLEYRKLYKLFSTYIHPLPLDIDPKTKRIHPTFNQFSTATGRLSCQKPNLQNIPTQSENNIRNAFKPEQIDWSFISADYSQIELRILAHLSEDPTLIKLFKEGEDIHAYTASLLFNRPISKISPNMRHLAKTVNFGIIYGLQPFGLAQELSISYNEATEFIQNYFQRYPVVKDFLESSKEKARKTGFATTIMGRERPIPEINSNNRILRESGERIAINTPIQGTAAELIKLAMIDIDRYLQNGKGNLLLQIHDELLFEAADSNIVSLSKEIQKIMEEAMKLKIPLKVNLSIGKNWGACYPC